MMDAYSSIGQTIVIYADSLTFTEQLDKLRFKKFSTLDAVLVMLFIWEAHDIVLHKMIPR